MGHTELAMLDSQLGLGTFLFLCLFSTRIISVFYHVWLFTGLLGVELSQVFMFVWKVLY